MSDREDLASPPLAARVRAAALRVLPVLLAAGAIWLWFGSIERECEPRLDAWVAAFEESLRSGSPRLPAPGRLADELLRKPVEAALAAPADPTAAVTLERSSRGGEAVVSWLDGRGARRHLELRCDGTSIAVWGVGTAPESTPRQEDETR